MCRGQRKLNPWPVLTNQIHRNYLFWNLYSGTKTESACGHEQYLVFNSTLFVDLHTKRESVAQGLFKVGPGAGP